MCVHVHVSYIYVHVRTYLYVHAYMYHIAGYFRGVLIFVTFVVCLQVPNISTHKFFHASDRRLRAIESPQKLD